MPLPRVVRCDCSFEATGATDDALVASVQDHALGAHGEHLSAEVVLGLAREQRREPITHDGEAGFS